MRTLTALILSVATAVTAAPAAASSAQLLQTAGGIEVATDAGSGDRILVVSMPDGRVVRRSFTGGESAVFLMTDPKGTPRPDGTYTWELQIAGSVAAAARDRMATARAAGDDETVEMLRRNGAITEGAVLSGTFRVAGGALAQPDAAERQSAPATSAATSGDGPRLAVAADQVIPDDLIVQSSGCFGFDCVNNESFGFDTIRLKENNTRIGFNDTSIGTFPSNDWTLVANDSASGGANFLGFEDVTGAKFPFKVTAGAPTNSLFVDSTGRVGFRTATPVLELHINDTDTPSLRLEQNNVGGFTAQTWDIGANEANFFVRDVTGGSKLSFRIRPGAPTSSLDIAADGNVGIGDAGPDEELDIERNQNAITYAQVTNNDLGLNSVAGFTSSSDVAKILFQTHGSGRTTSRFGQATIANWGEMVLANGNGLIVGTSGNTPLVLGTNQAARLTINGGGNVGIGTAPTSNVIQAASGAFLSAGGTWTNASSRALKHDIASLPAGAAVAALGGLEPVSFVYDAEPGETHLGFIAEDVPALVATGDRSGLSPMDLVAVLTRVVQEQQKAIAALTAKVEALERAD